MVKDALRGYLQLANGLTEVTRQRAQQVAKALLQQTGADTLTTKVSDLADEIVATSKSNRQLLQAIVANEVEGAVARLGFVRSEEVAALTRRVGTLEKEVAVLRGRAVPDAEPGPGPATKPHGDVLAEAVQGEATATTTPATEPTAEPLLSAGPATKAAEPAKKAPVTAPTAESSPSAGPAKKAAAKKAAAKKAAKKAPAKKTAKKA